MRRFRAGLRKLGRGFAHFFTHWSKKKILAVAALLLAGGAGVWLLAGRAQGAALPVAGTGRTRTTTLEKTTLQNTVTVTGTVKSDSVTNVSPVNTAAVAEIFVQEGDRVHEGQVLCKLDTTDLETELAKQRSTLADSIADAQKNYDRAVEARDTAYNNAVNTEGTVAAARDAVTATQQSFGVAQGSVAAFQAAYDAALADEQAKGVALNAVVTQDAAAGGDGTAAAVTDAQAAYNAAVAAREAAQAELSAAKVACGYDTLEQAAVGAQGAYETARKTLDGLESAYKTAQQAAEDAADRLADAKKSDAITTLEEKIADCTITAPAGGTITAMGATVGSAPGNSPLFVIQDTGALKVSVVIDEYDVKNISTGSRAILKSDATGDAEISGTLSQLSLTAAQDANTGAAGFGAEITVNDADSGLLIGMSVKAQLVLEEKTDVFAVPQDAVGTDAQGNRVVYVKNGDDFEPLVVTTGMETDYLVEISSGSLSEGMEIRSFADESVLTEETLGEGSMEGGMAMQGGPGGGRTDEVIMMPAAGMVGG